MNLWPFRKKAEARSATDESWAHVTSGTSAEISAMSAGLAENLSAVCACVDLISNSIASCPARVYRSRGEAGREELPAPRWLKAPNAYQSWPELVSFAMRQVLLYGNALIQVVESGGTVAELRAWPWQHVSWQVGNGAIRYTVTDAEGVYGPAGRRITLLADEVLHLKDAQELAYVGKPRLARARRVFSQADSAHSAAATLYQNSVRPSGALMAEFKIDKAGRQNLSTMLRDYFTGPANAGRGMILDNGMKWQPFQFNAEDSQLTEARRLSIEEVCRVFGVPGPLVNDLSHSSFSNAETVGRFFVVNALLPWVAKLEALFNRNVLPNGQTLEIDLSGLQRADYASRWTANNMAVNAGILSINEIREQEGFNPVPGGELPRTFNQAGAEGVAS